MPAIVVTCPWSATVQRLGIAPMPSRAPARPPATGRDRVGVTAEIDRAPQRILERVRTGSNGPDGLGETRPDRPVRQRGVLGSPIRIEHLHVPHLIARQLRECPVEGRETIGSRQRGAHHHVEKRGAPRRRRIAVGDRRRPMSRLDRRRFRSGGKTHRRRRCSHHRPVAGAAVRAPAVVVAGRHVPREP